MASLRPPAAAGARVQTGVGIADQGRVIAGLAHLARQVSESIVQRRTVAQRSVVHHVRAGQQRRPTRPTGRTLGEVVGEQHAVGGDGVEMGGTDRRMTAKRKHYLCH